MKRKIYQSLLKWKSSPDRKPLILEGARQVGKTFILKEFGQNEYDNLIYINCHNNEFASTLFQQDFDMERILRAISAYSFQSIVAGKTLIFLDEIQDAPNALASLKYFCEDARNQHVAAAGSLLGITHHEGESYPVGKVNTLRLAPMTFEEFLWAKGADTLAQIVAECDWKTMLLLDGKLQDLLRQYYYVGGMPEAVLNYVTNNDIPAVRRIQDEILSAYDHDFAKHAGNETQHIRMVWFSIPGQLAKENKKFIYGAVRKGARAKDFERAIQWLVDAGLVLKTTRSLKPKMPLSFYEDKDAFKLYLLDVGLLGALSKAPARQMLVDNSIFSEFKGSFTENYVLQQISASNQFPIYYFSKDNSTQEIDFLIQTDERVVPVEVKAEENVKSKSLHGFIDDNAAEQLKGLRCSMLPYIDQNWMENIPLYSVEGYFNGIKEV